MEKKDYFRPYSLPCHDFRDENGNYIRVSAIMVPISFDNSERRMEIGWGCSKGIACKNWECRYSRTMHDEKIEDAVCSLP